MEGEPLLPGSRSSPGGAQITVDVINPENPDDKADLGALNQVVNPENPRVRTKDALLNAPATADDIRAAHVLPVYKRRWYVLAVFSGVSFMQGGSGNVWTVIAQSAEAAFGWSDATVSLMQNWMYLTYLAGFFPFAWLIDKHGLRVAFVLASLLLALGSMFRCFASSPPLVTWFAHIGHILVGLAGPVAFGAGTVVSAEWFPVAQRNTATAVALLSGFSGCAFTFVFGSYKYSQNLAIDFLLIELFLFFSTVNAGHNYNISDIDAIRHGIMLCRYIEFAICGCLFLTGLVYFPARPPTPPTISATGNKTDLVGGLKELFRRKNAHFWLLAIPYALSLGIYGAWSGLIDVNLKPQGVTESEAGWLGFYSVVAGSIVGVIVGRINDVLTGRMKTILLALVAGEMALTFWFLLIAAGYVPFSSAGLYVSFIAQGVLMNASVPIFYELSIEKAYPVAEVVTSGMLNIVYNIIPLLFLLVFLVPGIGTNWMNWCMYGSLLVCVPLIIVFKEEYKRLDIDKGNDEQPRSD